MASELTFEVGKCYKTRDGRKATVLLIQPGYMVGEIEGLTDNPYIWDCNGSWAPGRGFPYSADLVAEWKEPRRVKVWWYDTPIGEQLRFYNVGLTIGWNLLGTCEIVEGEGME